MFPNVSALCGNLVEQPSLLPQELAHPKRILIIDGDTPAVEVLVRRLKRQGFETLVAESGVWGLELARVARPSLILLDLRLPDTDGLAICQKLVDSPETCGVPVIVVSSLEHPEILRRCRTAGCHFYVRKPYDPNALLVLIHQAIDETSRWREVG